MGKLLRRVITTDTIVLSEFSDGFWLWDHTRDMNLAMRAKTEQAAFIEALEYYQRRLLDVESKYKELCNKIDAFVVQFNNDEGED